MEIHQLKQVITVGKRISRLLHNLIVITMLSVRVYFASFHFRNFHTGIFEKWEGLTYEQ